jgi:hypothetical protein
LRQVKPEWRVGRGTWWRPNSLGYTDRLEKAGLYPEGAPDYPEDAADLKFIEVAAADVLAEEISLQTGRIHILQKMLQKSLR